MSKTRRNVTTHSNGNGQILKSNRFEELLEKREKEKDLSLKETVQGRTPNQKKYLRSINENDITIAIGCAGSGKTRLAIGMAATYLSKGLVDRIIIARPTVACDEDIGFLPGELESKIGPYLRPLTDELCDFFTDGQIAELSSGKRPVIEMVPLGMMKGRTFKRSFIILDEAQDATYKQIKRLLTRIGIGSKIVVTGDPAQSDKFMENYGTDLEKIIDRLEGLEGLSVIRLNPGDIQRHPRIGQILERL